MKAHIVFASDDINVINAVRDIFGARFEVAATASAARALVAISRGDVHVAVADQRMPLMLGRELLRQVARVSPRTVRVLLVPFADKAAAGQAVQSGEIDHYILKPWVHSELLQTINDAAAAGLRAFRASSFPEIAVVDTVVPAVEPITGTNAVPIDAKDEVPSTVLVVDDDSESFETIVTMLQGVARAVHAISIDAATSALAVRSFVVVVASLRVGGVDCLPLLQHLRHRHPHIRVVVLVDLGDANTIVKLLNQVPVFRVASKPIRKIALRLNLLAALRPSSDPP